MPITIVPNTDVTTATSVPVCFEASAIYSLPQEDERCIDLPESGTNWTFVPSNCMWKKTAGSLGVMDAPTLTGNTRDVYGLQPFWMASQILTFTTPPSPNRFYACLTGVLDTGDLFYGWYLWKNCGNRPVSECNAANNDDLAQGWKAFVYLAGAIVTPVPFNVNAGEWFRIRSTGTSLLWERQTTAGGTEHWVTHYQITLPNTLGWRFYLNSAYPNNEWYTIHTFKGTYQGAVPLTWTTPLGGTLTGDGNNRCFIVDSVGTYQVCVDSDFDDPVCVDIEVTPLFIEPDGYECGTDCVFTNAIINFTSNGGTQGVLTARDAGGHDVGTILGPLTWQAPGAPTHVIFTYTVGESVATCELDVVSPLELLNVEGDTIIGLVPGDTFQILDSYTAAGGTVVWSNLDCPNLVTADGLIAIPRYFTDSCFGAVDCYIRGLVTTVPDASCANLENKYFIDIRIIVDPIYPTPDFGGPSPLKWRIETPDFRVISHQFEGGCSETYIRNRVPIYKWTISYDGLYLEDPSQCPPTPCCDEPLGFENGINPNNQNAAILDNFWNYVYGTYGYFTLIDIKTGQRWKHVRFENDMTRDHINWRKVQSRTVSMIWNPCCEVAPAGGTCPHVTTIKDIANPTVPDTFLATGFSNTEIHLAWKPSYDDIGIKGYELEVTVGLTTTTIILPNILAYYHKKLTPNEVYIYRLRAFDFAGHYSDWTAPQVAATVTAVVESGDPVTESGDSVIEN